MFRTVQGGRGIAVCMPQQPRPTMKTILAQHLKDLIETEAPKLVESEAPLVPLGASGMMLVKAGTPEGDARIKTGRVVSVVKGSGHTLLVCTS